MSQSQQFQVSLEDTPYYHNCISRCISRCVCRAYLCSEDKYTAQSFEHFRKWMVERMHQLRVVLFYELINVESFLVNTLNDLTHLDLILRVGYRLQ